MSVEESEFRHQKLQSLLRSANVAEEKAEEFEGLITLKDGDVLEANFDVNDVKEVDATYEGKTRKQMQFAFKDKEGKERALRVAPRWAKPALVILGVHNGVARIKWSRFGSGKDDTQYHVQDKTPVA